MVTRKDIAEKAGVSVSVVSRALNNSGYVAADKKSLILQIADELGYHPNPVAMSLMSQRTKQIMFYCKDMKNAFNIELYRGMMEAAERQDYMVVVNGTLDFHRIRGIMSDGLILPNTAVAEVYLNTIGKNYHLPVVVAGYGERVTFPRSVPIVDCDYWKGMNKVLKYLKKRGHRKIAFITPYEWNNRTARTNAWKEFMQDELGDRMGDYFFGINSRSLNRDPRVLRFPEEQIESAVLMEENFFEKGELAACIFKERKCDATAVVCFNDEMSLGFCKQFRKLGGRIPEDVSVMGIDGTYARRYSEQMVTSLAAHPEKQGTRCAEVLLDMINGRKIKYFSSINTEILEGETVRNIPGMCHGS